MTVASLTQMLCDPGHQALPGLWFLPALRGVSGAEMLLGSPREGLAGNKSPLCAWGRPGHWATVSSGWALFVLWVCAPPPLGPILGHPPP